MKKKIVALFLGVLILLGLTIPVSAELRNGVYILDEKNYLSSSDYRQFQIQASELSEALDMDILYVLTYDEQPQICAQSLNLGSRTNQIMLIDNERTWEIVLFGTAQVLSEEQKQQLVDTYTLEPTFPEAISSYLAAAEAMVSEMNAAGAFAERVETQSEVSRTGETSMGDDTPGKPFGVVKWLVISLCTALLIVGGVVWARKKYPNKNCFCNEASGLRSKRSKTGRRRKRKAPAMRLPLSEKTTLIEKEYSES